MTTRFALLFTFGVACCSCLAQDPAASLGQKGRNGFGEKLWVSGQVNFVNQSHPSFPSEYSGPASLREKAEQASTWVATLYTGYAITPRTEIFFDLESARGAGVSGALGLGGLGDLDAVTDHGASARPYVARLQLRHIIPLGTDTEEATRNPLGLNATLPSRRLELRFGKMSLTDFFDLNSVGSDSHMQFLNYSIDNNAVYDIAANSRGYTYAALAELYQPRWTARFAIAFQPKDTSGRQFEWNLSRSRSENFEFEIRPRLMADRSSTLRGLVFVNHATMTSYPEAVTAYLKGEDTRPDLSAHLRPRSMSYGFGVNAEQELSSYLRLFGRAGWNEGSKEAFQFAEADGTFAAGGDVDGRKWRHQGHRAGGALAVNALAEAHRRYLQLGGTSYLLGDGGLQYAREVTLEAYYNIRLHRGVYASFDVQRIWNPGYNHNRGPVLIFGLRLHLEGDLHFK